MYVYEGYTLNLISISPIVVCSKHFNMGKDTLSKYHKYIMFISLYYFGTICSEVYFNTFILNRCRNKNVQRLASE